MPAIDPHDAAAVAAEYYARAARDFHVFIRGLIIAGGQGPRLFRDVMAPFQAAAFRDVAPALQAVQVGAKPPCQRFWWERTKKAGKDSDLAACLLWVIAFPQRPLYAQVGAADRDQAAIVKRRLEALLYHNAWLNDYVEIQTNKVRSKLTGPSGQPLATLDIMAADVAGSHGETPDFLVINELSHVKKFEFVENLMSNAAGVPHGVVMVATNAGFKGEKPEVWRNVALKDGWSCHIWSEPAPWHSPEAVRGEERLHTPSRFKRLWWGKWSSNKGDALDEVDIEQMFSMPGPVLSPENGWDYIAGLDLGVSHDHSGAVILGVHPGRQRVRVVNYRGWEPLLRTGKVDLMGVEDWLLAMHRCYKFHWLGCDPHQAELMMQRLRVKGVPAYGVPFTSASCTEMASALLDVMKNRRLEAYDDVEGRLRRDLGRLSIIEKQYGYKLESVKDEHGHADVGTALCIALPRAIELLAGMNLGLRPDDELATVEVEQPLTRGEIQALPAELRDIYEMDYDPRYEHQEERISIGRLALEGYGGDV